MRHACLRAPCVAWPLLIPSFSLSFFWLNFIFLRKKGDFSDVFSAFYGQRSVTAAWATRSPWSIFGNFYYFTKKLIFWLFFLLFTASVR